MDCRLQEAVDVSVIVPVFNEAECIATVVEETIRTLATDSGRTYEVLVVDDGSADETPLHLRRLQAAHAMLRVVTLNRNSGQSAAFSAGFAHARGRVFVTMDGDGQNDPADIPRLLDYVGKYGCCCGIRQRRQDVWSRRVGSRVANQVRNWILQEDIIDTGCSLKAVQAEYARGLHPWNGMHRFFPALFRMRGASVHQLPVNHRRRFGGHSKYTNWGRLQRTIWDLLAVRWMKERALSYQAVEQVPSLDGNHGCPNSMPCSGRAGPSDEAV